MSAQRRPAWGVRAAQPQSQPPPSAQAQPLPQLHQLILPRQQRLPPHPTQQQQQQSRTKSSRGAFSSSSISLPSSSSAHQASASSPPPPSSAAPAPSPSQQRSPWGSVFNQSEQPCEEGGGSAFPSLQKSVGGALSRNTPGGRNSQPQQLSFEVCGSLDQGWGAVRRALTGGEPLLLHSTLLVSVSAMKLHLSEGGRRLASVRNAGARQSVDSEILSFELLHTGFGATLQATETELQYTSPGAIIDYSVHVFGHTVGVSVTRVARFQLKYQQLDIVTLLRKKLQGCESSAQRISEQHRWSGKILHVWASDEQQAQAIASAYEQLRTSSSEDDRACVSNTIVLVTVPQNASWIW